MTQTLLASFRFPQHLTQAAEKSFAAQELIDFLKIDPSYFHQSFRRKFKPKPASAEAGDILTGDPMRAQTLDIGSATRASDDLLAATAALADFHRLVVREHVDGWEAIEPDFAFWHRFPGAYVLWTAKIIDSSAQSSSPNQRARLRIVRQRVANVGALDAVSSALGLLPRVSIDGEDMIVSYIAQSKQRPALTVES